MNITKEFLDHESNLGVQISPFLFKCEMYSPIHICNRILQQISDTEKNISQIESMSKRSSSFNDQHLKFSNASSNIKRCLMDIETEIKTFKDKELRTVNSTLSKTEQAMVNNSFDIINSRASDLTLKFQKFLAKQAELIKKVEDRKTHLSLNSFNDTGSNNFMNDLVNNPDDEDDVLLNVQTQAKKKDNYYQERLNEVQSIEKTMQEISGMMNRLSQMTYHHALMIDNISKNTDLAYDNVEKGANEIKKMYDDVKSNRKLLIKIFLIIIVTAVVYILLFA